MPGRRWTHLEDEQLAFDWGVFHLATLARRMGRTAEAIKQRAKRLKLGLPARGTTTVKTLARRTGYDERQVRNAARVLGINIGRRVVTNLARAKTRYTSIDEVDATQIVQFLGAKPDAKRIRFEHQGAWGERGRGGHMKPDCCLGCGKSDQPHYAKDRCRRCYRRLTDTGKENRSGTGVDC